MFQFSAMAMLSAATDPSKWQPSTPLNDAEASQLFKDWQAEFAANSADFSSWKTNLDEVIAINSQGGSWQAGLNEYSHLTWQEFKAYHNLAPQNCSATLEKTTLPALHYASADLPQQKDWRKDIPIHVKNQGHCGSCWTFSTTGAVEAHNYLSTGNDVLLAEQQLVDCAGAFDNHGCSGGLPSHAFEYLHYFGGQMTEADYPYTAQDGTCTADASKVAATVVSQVNITFMDEDQLHEAVGKYGPVSVAYQVASDFRHYAGGVYSSTVCGSRPEDVNHAVLAVGYDHDEASGKDYWIVKNSWGTSFGVENGYFWMERGANMCGVSDCAAFPICGGAAVVA